MFSKIQYISQGTDAQTQLEHIHAVLDAGCDWVQLRCKQMEEAELYKLAGKVRELTKAYNAVFIVNDATIVARDADADGVHLGLSDMPVAAARALLGPDKIIGGTANTLEHVLQRQQEGCSYIGLGPYRFTTTKERLAPILGIESYRHIMAACTKDPAAVPVYAVGGIMSEDVSQLHTAGIYGIAVSGMLSRAADKKTLLQVLQKKLYANTGNCG